MDRYFIDFETQSDLDIKKVGAMKYLHTPHSDIICMSWCLNPPPYGKGTVKLWIPPAPMPFSIGEDCRVYSFNALFEYRVWNILGRRYTMDYLPLFKMVDVQALCNRFAFPQSLDKAAKVLNVKHKKSATGTRLMSKITQPPFKCTQEELREFYSYCIRDTEAMIDIVNALPTDSLSLDEQAIWEETMEINKRGVPIDLPLVKRVWATVEYFKKQELKKVPKITNQQVRNVTQRNAVMDWCLERGVHLPDLTKETVAETLEDETIPPDVRQLLELRQTLSKTSVAKYKRLLHMTYNGRIYDNLRYHRATTGRWGGLGFQAHNLPRASVDDIDYTIQCFYDTSILQQDVMHAASALIRSVICAGEGAVLGVADYKSIENVIIAWVAGEERILELHRKGLDEYKDFATELFGIKYDDVTKEQRRMCKPIILGAGYNLGAYGLQGYADGMGVYLTHEQAQTSINTYRTGHRRIKQMWYELRDGAIMAIQNPNEPFAFPQYKGTTFLCQKDRTGREWLILTLPSGRGLFYPDPDVKEDTYGLIPTHMGLNSKNHQWQRLKLIPGRITENIVQALARDYLAEGKMRLAKSGFDVILSVHDEVVVELPQHAKHQLKNMIELMCINPSWCPDMPMDAEGVITRRYYKI